MDEPFLTLVDTTTQWIFNKNVLYGGDSSCGTANLPKGQYLQLVMSASYDLVQKSRQEIIRFVFEGSSRGGFPAARENDAGEVNGD